MSITVDEVLKCLYTIQLDQCGGDTTGELIDGRVEQVDIIDELCEKRGALYNEVLEILSGLTDDDYITGPQCMGDSSYKITNAGRERLEAQDKDKKTSDSEDSKWDRQHRLNKWSLWLAAPAVAVSVVFSVVGLF